jgi:hypothetical protein
MDDNSVAMVGAKPWGAARLARWAGQLGVILPGITLVVYPIWSVPRTQTSGADVRRGPRPTTIVWS